MPEKSVTFYAYWANRYLTFSKRLKNADAAEALRRFLEDLQSRENIADWQIQQAEGALHLYLYHFKGADILKEARGVARAGKGLSDFPRLLGHKNVETTMIYTHVLRDMKNAPQSPLDALYGNRQ